VRQAPGAGLTDPASTGAGVPEGLRNDAAPAAGRGVRVGLRAILAWFMVAGALVAWFHWLGHDDPFDAGKLSLPLLGGEDFGLAAAPGSGRSGRRGASREPVSPNDDCTNLDESSRPTAAPPFSRGSRPLLASASPSCQSRSGGVCAWSSSSSCRPRSSSSLRHRRRPCRGPPRVGLPPISRREHVPGLVSL
jgi:hypothetical protein